MQEWVGGEWGTIGSHESIENSFRLVDAVSSIPPLPLKLNTILALSDSSNYSSLSLNGLLNNIMSQIISWGSMPPDSTGILMHYTWTENCVQCLLYQSPLLVSQAWIAFSITHREGRVWWRSVGFRMHMECSKRWKSWGKCAIKPLIK